MLENFKNFELSFHNFIKMGLTCFFH